MSNPLKSRGTITARTPARTEIDLDVQALNLRPGDRVMVEHHDDTAAGEIIDARTVLVHCGLGRVGDYCRVRRPIVESLASGRVVQA